MINVLIVDDHPAVGEGTRTIIESEQDMKADVLFESDKIMEVLEKGKYDIYLIDLYMPKMNGIELTKMILQFDPDATILIYTGYDVVSHFNLLIEAGASGFISKTSTREQLITSIRCSLRDEAVISIQLLKQLKRVESAPSVNEGKQYLEKISLSTKEQKILDGISKGHTNKAIALELSMSQRTVEYHLTKIFTKLGVGSRTEALLKSEELGLLSIFSVKN
ncbi:response regulator transcription factor [Bacillus norwichensis]|uniref:Response regulator transcription factor n=1 Tax=Bacillus norwichensis TaxID=2762217 RepID=A0ABR8VSA2_9BACI|nr:response regulator transcription factor [Bacillus norwichensis]MBD8007623.1 response regulator transcription factor [Bacillus norwichensis]